MNINNMTKYVVAVTGGICSGKTVVSNIFSSLGQTAIDADLISRDIIESNKSVYYDIKEYFGNIVINKDKSINRKKIRKLIFKYKKKENGLIIYFILLFKKLLKNNFIYLKINTYYG